jgi:hypothetical protein
MFSCLLFLLIIRRELQNQSQNRKAAKLSFPDKSRIFVEDLQIMILPTAELIFSIHFSIPPAAELIFSIRFSILPAAELIFASIFQFRRQQNRFLLPFFNSAGGRIDFCFRFSIPPAAELIFASKNRFLQLHEIFFVSENRFPRSRTNIFLLTCLRATHRQIGMP